MYPLSFAPSMLRGHAWTRETPIDHLPEQPRRRPLQICTLPPSALLAVRVTSSSGRKALSLLHAEVCLAWWLRFDRQAASHPSLVAGIELLRLWDEARSGESIQYYGSHRWHTCNLSSMEEASNTCRRSKNLRVACLKSAGSYSDLTSAHRQ